MELAKTKFAIPSAKPVPVLMGTRKRLQVIRNDLPVASVVSGEMLYWVLAVALRDEVRKLMGN